MIWLVFRSFLKNADKIPSTQATDKTLSEIVMRLGSKLSTPGGVLSTAPPSWCPSDEMLGDEDRNPALPLPPKATRAELMFRACRECS